MFLYPCSLHIVARGTYPKKKPNSPLWSLLASQCQLNRVQALWHMWPWLLSTSLASFLTTPLLFVHTLGLSGYLKSTEYHMLFHAVTFWLHEKSFPPLFTELTIIPSAKFSSDFIFSRKPFQNPQLTLYPPLICWYLLYYIDTSL